MTGTQMLTKRSLPPHPTATSSCPCFCCAGSLKAHSRESSLTTPLLPVSHQADDFHHSGVIDGENVDQQGGPPTCAGVLVEEEFPPYGAGADAKATPQRDVLYGLINAIVGIPTMISFTAIVYQVSCSDGVL